ncbi:hypothetical protein M405DRAFT_847518 [Rhizopogon salebrosus TDB-379]|nr:hypothetical protein M405DRAFT_847518 [Rhizopogon salebrosus TDB-379]
MIQDASIPSMLLHPIQRPNHLQFRMPHYQFPPSTPTGMTPHKVHSRLLLAESGSILRKNRPRGIKSWSRSQRSWHKVFNPRGKENESVQEIPEISARECNGLPNCLICILAREAILRRQDDIVNMMTEVSGCNGPKALASEVLMNSMNNSFVIQQGCMSLIGTIFTWWKAVMARKHCQPGWGWKMLVPVLVFKLPPAPTAAAPAPAAAAPAPAAAAAAAAATPAATPAAAAAAASTPAAATPAPAATTTHAPAALLLLPLLLHLLLPQLLLILPLLL